MRDEEIYAKLEQVYFGPRPDEATEIRALPALLRDSEVFVDVGASLGLYTFHANQILHGASIYALEADPIRYRKLAQNCAEWGRGGQNKLIPVHAAVADVPGRVVFQTTESTVSGGLFRIDRRSSHWQGVEVDATTIDVLCRGHLGARHFIKMDIEGGEYRALLGALHLLSRARTRLLVELHSWGDPQWRKYPWDVVDYLCGLGYAPTKTIGRTPYFEPCGFPRRHVCANLRGVRLRARQLVLPWARALLRR